MIFRPDLAAKVMAGEKTVTRRLCNENPRSPWWREVCGCSVGGGPGGSYAVQPGRGVDAIGRVRVLDVRRETLAAIYWARQPGHFAGIACAEREAGREGFGTFAAFREAWVAINGAWEPLAEVWRVEFELA